MTQDKIIIGIDPGTIITGYGIICVSDRGVKTIDYGCIKPPANQLLSDRYLIIYDSLLELLIEYKPTVMAIESQFVHKNVQSALKLGGAKGAAIIGAKKHGLKIFGYSPTEVKQTITGTGKASKQQLQSAVARFLNLKELPQPYDAADALAIALCYARASEGSLFTHTKEI